MKLSELLAHFVSVQDQDAASLFGDVNDEELAPDGHFWVRFFEVGMCVVLNISQRRLKMVLLKVKSFGGRLFAA